MADRLTNEVRLMGNLMIMGQAELTALERQKQQKTGQAPSPLEAEMRARTKRLLRPGYVERLVNQGRTPRIIGEPPFICQIPPEGIQPGDSVDRAYDDIVLEFFAPDGTSRGRETSVHITPRQAARIQVRIDRASAVRTWSN